MKNIEVEVRGLLTEKEFNQLTDFLNSNSDKQEDANKTACYFVLPNDNLKVSNDTSQGTCKIAFKPGAESQAAKEEIELSIQPEEYDSAIRLFVGLGFEKFQCVEQKRKNYWYKDSEIAVKFSSDWGYHFEIEKMVSEESESGQAVAELLKIAEELNLKVLSPEEQDKLIAKIKLNK